MLDIGANETKRTRELRRLVWNFINCPSGFQLLFSLTTYLIYYKGIAWWNSNFCHNRIVYLTIFKKTSDQTSICSGPPFELEAFGLALNRINWWFSPVDWYISLSVWLKGCLPLGCPLSAKWSSRFCSWAFPCFAYHGPKFLSWYSEFRWESIFCCLSNLLAPSRNLESQLLTSHSYFVFWVDSKVNTFLPFSLSQQQVIFVA